MNSIRLLLTVGLVVLASACQTDVTAPPRPTELTPDLARGSAASDYVLTVLHNNDGESDLLSDGPAGGVARFATLVDRVRHEIRSDRSTGPGNGLRLGRRDAILVSSGDNFLASAEFTASLENGVPFYDALALDAIGYDAFAIGNHEFDFGPDVLADFIGSFGPGAAPWLSANLDVGGEPSLAVLESAGRIASSTIVELRGTRVGVIGATTPRLPEISSPRGVLVDEDVAGAINAQVAALEAVGVNKIVLISHLQSLLEDQALIPMLDGVDVVVAGGGDELLANPGDLLIPGDTPSGAYPIIAFDMDGTAVPVVTTSGQYRYLGRLDVHFDKDGNVTSVGGKSGPIRVVDTSFPDGVALDPAVKAAAEDPVRAYVALLAATVVGQSQVPLDGRRSQVRTVETNEGNLIADALFWKATQLAPSFGAPTPDVALQNGGGIRNDGIVPVGPITRATTDGMVPFANFVTIVPSVSRAQFLDILENAVSRREFVDGRFTQVSGFSFSFDPAAPAGSRVVDVTLDGGTAIVVGGVVQAGGPINIATIDFLARGGDGYPFGGIPFTTLGVTYLQALEDYIATGLGGTITAADYPEGGEGRITVLP